MVTFRKIFGTIVNSVHAIFTGEFLLRLGIDRYFTHVLYCFLLIGVAIWMSLIIDKTLNKVERGKETISRLAIIHTMNQFELEKKNSREAVLLDLRRLGSDLQEPEKPASTLE